MTPEGSPIKNLAQRHAEVAEQRRIEAEAWTYCCHLSEKERVASEAAMIKAEEERVAGLHLSYVLRKQAVNGGRWNEICRLRAMEVFQGRVGLVMKVVITLHSVLDHASTNMQNRESS